MKKILSLLVISILVLAGCSSTNASDEKVVVWAMGNEGKMLSSMTELYMEEFDVEVEVVPIPWSEARNKLQTAVAAKEGPDLVQMPSTWLAEFSEVGALADLSEFTDEFANFDKSLYFDGIQGTMEYNGVFTSVPWFADASALFYRTDLLEEVGYTEPPATWDEFLDVSQKLVNQGVTTYGPDFYTGSQLLSFQGAYTNGWEHADAEGKPNFLDPKYAETLEFINQFFVQDLALFEDEINESLGFSTERIAMFFSGPWRISILENDYPELDGKWTVAPLPHNGTETAAISSANFVIWEWSQNKKATAHFANWMLEDEQQVAWYTEASVLPSKKTAWDADVLQNDEMVATFGKILETAQMPPFIPEWETLAQEVIKQTDIYFYGEQTIDETVEKIQLDVTKIVE